MRVSSNSANDSRGIAFGLQGNLYFPVVMAGIVSIAIFTMLLLKTAYPVPKAFAVAAVPFAATLLFVMLFINGKKPHYASDLFASLTTDGSFGRPFGQPQHPVKKATERATKEHQATPRNARA